MKYKYIYGPVPSWRLGSSLGIDPVYTGKEKICSFDCIYCQVGGTALLAAERKIYVPTAEIVEEIKSLSPVKIDYITFSGAGEPTLAENLGGIIKEIRKVRGEKIAVFTNSSVIDKKDVQEDLRLADFVVAKLDAHSEKLFGEISKPAKGIKFDNVIKGLKAFRARCGGKMALQIMFLEQNKKYAGEISALAREINPDEIQLNTPLRPCGVNPLSKEEMDEIKKFFEGTIYISVYDARRKTNVRRCHNWRRSGGPHGGDIHFEGAA